MIYEGRLVKVIRGMDEEWISRIVKEFFPMLKKHGAKPVGAYQTVIGNSQDFYLVIGFDSQAHREKVFESMANDPDYQKMDARWNKQPSISNLYSTIIKPVPLPKS